MHEQRDLVIRTRLGRVTYDQSAKQPAIYVGGDVANVIVKSPRPDHLCCDLEYISPSLAGQNLVTAATGVGGYTEGPRAVGVDSILQPVEMETVAIVLVPVQNVDA